MIIKISHISWAAYVTRLNCVVWHWSLITHVSPSPGFYCFCRIKCTSHYSEPCSIRLESKCKGKVKVGWNQENEFENRFHGFSKSSTNSILLLKMYKRLNNFFPCVIQHHFIFIFRFHPTFHQQSECDKDRGFRNFELTKKREMLFEWKPISMGSRHFYPPIHTTCNALRAPTTYKWIVSTWLLECFHWKLCFSYNLFVFWITNSIELNLFELLIT